MEKKQPVTLLPISAPGVVDKVLLASWVLLYAMLLAAFKLLRRVEKAFGGRSRE